MFGSKSFARRRSLRILAISLAFHGLIANAIPPEPGWWHDGNPPVIDLTASPDNHGMASIGQAKWMVSEALRALDATAPQIAAAIRSDLNGASPANRIVDLSVPDPKTSDWIDKQKAPLLLGQLKAIAAPFYKRLQHASPDWLDHSGTGQLQLNGTKDPNDTLNFYPWSSAPDDDRNKAASTIGQLKAVFSLRFESLAIDPDAFDFDGDGLPDVWEIAHNIDPHDDGSINPQNGPSGNFGTTSVTNAEAYALGVQSDPQATPGNLDGDSLLNDEDAAPREKLIDWHRAPETSYVVIDLNMQPLSSFSAPHGRYPVPAILNDHNEVCREAYPMDGEATPATWDGQTFPITWTSLPDFTSAAGIDQIFDDLAFSFNNSHQTYHGLHLDDGSDDSLGVRSITIEWGGLDSTASRYGDYSTRHTHRAVYSRFNQLAEEEFIYSPGGGVKSTVIAPGFTVTSTQPTNLPKIERFNFYSRAPDITRTGKILVSQSGGLKINNIALLDSFPYGITDDPNANTLVVVPEAPNVQSVKTKRYRNGAWETMPMPGIMDMNASGVGITFPDHQLWRNGQTVDLNTLLSGSGWEDFKVEQINEGGTLLGSAKKIGGNGDFLPVLLPRVEVVWKVIDGYDNVDDHIDPWTKVKNGKRIFPDCKKPTESEIRNKLEVIVKTSPTLTGKTVFVKSFDVDDSTSEGFDHEEGNTTSVIDSNGKAGGDNLPDYLNTQQNGQFWTGSAWGGQTAQGTVDANGETKFIFRVGMQPGNNYRVVASVIDESMYAGVQTTDPAAATYLGPEISQNGGAAASPLLTVWRRLWVENDSMEAIPIEVGYKGNDLRSDAAIQGIHDAFLDSTGTNTWLPISPIIDYSSFKNLEKGRIIFQSVSHPVVNTAVYGGSTGAYHVLVSGNYTSVPNGSGFRLYDDDDGELIADALPRRNLVNEQMKSYFKSSYIDVVDASQFNSPNLIPLHLNEDVSVYNPSTVVDDERDLMDKNECWVCPVTAAYQGPQFEGDHDGEEGFLFGETAPHGSYDSENYYDHSTVFIETCREVYDNTIFLRNSKSQKVEDGRKYLERWIIAVISHEMGHQPGNQEDDHTELGLMAGGSEGITSTAPENAKFSAKTILRFRKSNRWSK